MERGKTSTLLVFGPDKTESDAQKLSFAVVILAIADHERSGVVRDRHDD